MAGCSVEINQLPVLTGCPSPSEMILVSGAVGGAGAGMYALRSISNILSCISSITFPELNTIVGVDGVLNSGDVTYVIGQEVDNPVQNIIPQSVKVIIEGTPIYPVAVTNQIYITIVYGTNNTVTINFFNYSIDNPTENLGLQYGMKVMINYAISN